MNRQRGVTLVELMLAISIGALIILTVVPLFRQANMVFKRSEVRSKAVMETRTALELITRTVGRGKAGTWLISSPDPQHPYSKLDFRIAADDSIASLFVSNGNLVLKTGRQEPMTLASHVDLLTFTGDTADAASVKMTLRISAPIPGREPYTMFIPNRELHLTE